MPDVMHLAQEAGFELYASITPDDVVTDRALAQSCSQASCKQYASCWSCPPGAGSFEELQDHFIGKDSGVLVQTIRDDVDVFEDYEQIAEICRLHNDRLDRLAGEIRHVFPGALEFSTGGCDLCTPCSYPDAPCKKPSEQRLALSAHGVAVSTTCENAGLDYSFENGRIRFVGMVLFSTESAV